MEVRRFWGESRVQKTAEENSDDANILQHRKRLSLMALAGDKNGNKISMHHLTSMQYSFG